MTAVSPSKIILLVEDNPDDVFLMRRVLQKANLPISVKIVSDGKKAIEYFKLTVADHEGRLPDFAFLDLKLPYLDGFEILTWVRQQPKLQKLPVAVLTSSVEDKDRERANSLGVQYLVKPPTLEMIDAVLRVLNMP